MKKVIITLAAAAIGFGAGAQDKKKTNKADEGFIPVAAGMDYKIVKDAPGDNYPDYGDFIELHVTALAADSVIFDTRDAMNSAPAPLQMQRSAFKGDLMEALRKLTPGDSAVVRITVDSLLAAGAPEASWMKRNTNQKLIYKVKLVTVKTMEQKQKEDREHAGVQKEIDDKLIKEYLDKNNIKAKKTESGLYYTIDREGTGAKAEAGQKVSVNYTGKLLNGQVFDSNVLPEFNHVEPFEFMLGTGSVIRGWDEGIALLSKGAKATLYIPSGLAYGPNPQGPRIPANSVLVFDVELVDIKPTEVKN